MTAHIGGDDDSRDATVRGHGRDYAEENDGALIAVIWKHIDVAASAAPVTTAEVGWGLVDCKLGHMPTLSPGTEWSLSMDIFVLGDGSDFDRPN